MWHEWPKTGDCTENTLNHSPLIPTLLKLETAGTVVVLSSMKWAQQSPTLKTKKSKNSGNSGSRFPKREVSSWRSSMGSSSWRPRPKLPLMSRMLSSHWRVTSRYGLLSWWGDVNSICSWIIDYFCGQVNMEKRLEAQNPPRPTGGVQLGQNDGARKNVMAWLSRCSILWSVTLSLINAVLDHEEKTVDHDALKHGTAV